uniref:SDE2-like domain-containing protein n=1 Tax=Culex quinquefasciatus TaxID=7176 RepID=A0A904MX38_CULQU
MVHLIYNNHTILLEVRNQGWDSLHASIETKTGLPRSEYYLTQNGKRLTDVTPSPLPDVPIRLQERLPAGKGGFGSMLRAIGAQIEKTTNREACRDLSGRRLRDINEEKRLKAYLDKQKEADTEDEAAKLQKKVDKLLAKPKHEFHDARYNQARTDLTQNVDEAVQEGLRRAAEVAAAGEGGSKRKAKDDGSDAKGKKKKAKGALWLGADDLGSSSDDGDSDDGSDSAGSSSGVSSAKQTVGPTSEEDESGSADKEVEVASG